MGARTGILRVAMRERLRKGLLPAAAAWLPVPPRGAEATDGHDPDDVVYATGAIFESEADLADRPRTHLFRAFLPTAPGFCAPGSRAAAELVPVSGEPLERPLTRHARALMRRCNHVDLVRTLGPAGRDG